MHPDLDPNLHRELFRVTNDLHRLHANGKRVTWKEYRDILAALCSSLKTSFENGLDRAIRYYGSVTEDPALVRQAEGILRDVSRFATFLKIEKEILIQCGATKGAAEDIVRHISALREGLSVSNYNSAAVLRAATGFMNAACKASHEVGDQLRNERDWYKSKKGLLRGYGIALSLANASIVVITWGGSAPISVLSGALGGALIVAKGDVEDPADRRWE